MKQKIEKKSLNIFVDKVKQGAQLSNDEIQGLDQVKKKEYVRARLQYDSAIQNYLRKKVEEAQNEQDDFVELEQDVTDTVQKLADEGKMMAKRFERRKTQLGMG